MSCRSKFRLWLGTTQGALWYFGISYSLIALLMIYLLCWPAHAAIHPDTTMPSISPEKALEKQKSAPTHYRVLIYPNGRKQYVGMFTIWERCK